MKKIRIGLMALAALTGISGAFAFSPKANLTTYYAQVTGPGTFHWSTTKPDTICSPDGSVVVACTIVTNTAPTDNILPAGHTDTHDAYPAD